MGRWAVVAILLLSWTAAAQVVPRGVAPGVLSEDARREEERPPSQAPRLRSPPPSQGAAPPGAAQAPFVYRGLRIEGASALDPALLASQWPHQEGEAVFADRTVVRSRRESLRTGGGVSMSEYRSRLVGEDGVDRLWTVSARVDYERASGSDGVSGVSGAVSQGLDIWGRAVRAGTEGRRSSPHWSWMDGMSDASGLGGAMAFG